MGKYHWHVKLPTDGENYTREQAWAALEKERQALEQLAKRSQAESYSGQHDKRSPLLPEECEELAAIRGRLRDLAAKLEGGPLEQLAEIADEPESRFPKDITKFLDSYHGDFTRFCRNHKGADILTLGFAVLQAGGFEDDRITELLAKVENTQYRRHGKVFVCPRCDRYGEVRKQGCKLCFGWGYVIREKEPEADEYDLSTAGKIAANEGREWTTEQEAAEQKRLNEESAE